MPDRQRHLTVDRADIDQRSVALGLELPHRGLAAIDHALQIDINRATVVRKRNILEPPVRPDAGVVDPDVDPTEAGQRRGCEPLDLLRFADIGGNDQRRPTRGADLIGNLLEQFGTARRDGLPS